MTRVLESRIGTCSRAELTQLVECQLPKLDVAGSNPVLRSISPDPCEILEAAELSLLSEASLVTRSRVG
jgi:hypothetical protein